MLTSPQRGQRRRSADDRMLAGMALYFAAWLLIPENGEDQPVAAAWIAAARTAPANPFPAD